MSRYVLDTNVLLHVVNRAKGYELIVSAACQLQPGSFSGVSDYGVGDFSDGRKSQDAY